MSNTIYYARAIDQNACTSNFRVITISVVRTPPPPEVSSLYLCTPGVATFTINNFGVYPRNTALRIYTTESGGTPIAQENRPFYSFSVSTNTTYYFAAQETSANCESFRTRATVEISESIPFTIVRNTPNPVCGHTHAEIEIKIVHPGAYNVELREEENGVYIARATEAPYRLITPTILATTTYWVSVGYQEQPQCFTTQPIVFESAPLPPAPEVELVPVQCKPGNVPIIATLPNSDNNLVLRLYNEEGHLINASIRAPYTFQTPFLTTDAEFYLETHNPITGCISRRTGFSVIFQGPIEPPTVQDVILCQPGEATFHVPPRAGFDIFVFESLQQTRGTKVENRTFSVFVQNQPVVRYFRFQDPNGCQSLPTEARASIATPVNISIAPITSICGKGKQELKVELDASVPYTVSLINSRAEIIATAWDPPYRFQTPELDETQEFRILAVHSTLGCSTEKMIRVEVIARPPMPILLGSPLAACGASTVTFTAGLTGGSTGKEVLLYTLPVGGQIMQKKIEEPFVFSVSITTSTTFYLATNIVQSVCESASRLPVILQVAPIPTPPIVSSVSVCAAGTAVFSPLLIEPKGDRIRVFDAPVGGNLLIEVPHGQTIALPVNRETEVYYFQAYSSQSGCKSDLTAVIARILPPLSLAYEEHALRRCGPGSFTFSVLLNGAARPIIQLYDQRQVLVDSITASVGVFTIPTVNTSTTWLLKGIDKSTGCEVRKNIQTSIEPPPAAPIAPNIVEYCNNSRRVAFTAQMGVPAGSLIVLYTQENGGEPIARALQEPYTFSLLPEVDECTYYLEAHLGECVSSRRAVVVRKVRVTPPRSTDVSRVDAGPVTFTVQPGDSRGKVIRLYSADNQLLAQAMQPPYEIITSFLTTTTTFYLRSYDSELDCLSEAIAVVASIIPRPPQPILASSYARCGPGSVVISPSLAVNNPRNYNIRLYTINSGGQPIGEYSYPFIIELSQNTSTCYFLETYEVPTATTSASRASTCVNILSVPEPPMLTSAVQRCGSGQVSFSFTSQGGIDKVLIYSQERSGIPLREVLPPLVVTNWQVQTTTTYYASSRLGQCEGERRAFTVEVLPLPPAPLISSFELCNIGPQTITLSGLAQGLAWRVYNSSDVLMESRSNEAVFSLSLNQSTTLWASAYDLNTGCESNRTSFAINLIPPPQAPLASDIFFCTPGAQTFTFTVGPNLEVEVREVQGGRVLRSYAAGVCSSGCSFSTPSLTTTTTYYLEAIDSRTRCRSSVKEVRVVSQMPLPPRVEPIPICSQGGFVTFTYSLNQTGANQIRLYRSVGNVLINTANQQEGLLHGPYITMNTSFLISSYNTQTRCESPRVAYTVPVRAPLPLPIANHTKRCPNQSVTIRLTIPQELSGLNLQVYATPTAGIPIYATTQLQDEFTLPPSTQSDTLYLVYRDPSSGCMSGQQPLMVTITPPPPAPNHQTIISCGEQVVTIKALPMNSAIPELAEYRLYTQAAAIEPLVVSTIPPYDVTIRTVQNATYYFAGRDLQTGCESRRAVIRIQRNNLPPPPIAQPSSILLCRPSGVTISASFSGPEAQGIRLYTVAEGGDFVAIRTVAPYHFHIPLVTTTTTFYLESWNTGFVCNTSERTPVVVHIDPTLEPLPPSANTLVQFCRGSTVEFTALPVGNTTQFISLYTSSAGGMEVERKEPPFVFSLSDIYQDSTIYLESINSVCNSRQRTPVLLQPFVKPPLPEVQSLERCGAGVITFTVNNANARHIELWNAQHQLIVTVLASQLVTTPFITTTTVYGIRLRNDGCQGDLKWVEARVQNCTPFNCGSPAKPSLVSVTSNSATIKWLAAPGATRYIVACREIGGNLVVSNVTTETEITLRELLAGKDYEVSIRAECMNEGQSIFSAGVSLTFQTANLRQGLNSSIETIRIYPNPSQGKFFLEFSALSQERIYHLSLWDMQGNEIWRKDISAIEDEQKLLVELQDLDPATYILCIRTLSGVFFYPIIIYR
ncbi:MAG: fibronectin type III domain-containing protein [Bacteroidia bacterium]|nr:fibronectin type III domain-containing protein [Bacteroidia bacterium]